MRALTRPRLLGLLFESAALETIPVNDPDVQATEVRWMAFAAPATLL